MSAFTRLKISTAVVAALLAGLALHGGDANAKNGNGGSGHGAVANGAQPQSAQKTPVYSCWACRFVKRDKDTSKSGHDAKQH